MALFSFEERPNSRSSTRNPPAETRIWIASGEFNKSTVEAYAMSATPLIIATLGGTLYRQNLSIDPQGFEQYEVTVPYGPKQAGALETGAVTFSFDGTGATIHVTTSREHINSYPAGDPTNPHAGVIGVTKDGQVEGCDIIVPALKLIYTFRHPSGQVNEVFARALAAAAGKTNSATFRGFAAGELLFLGATGSDGSEAEAEVTYQFAASSNETGLTIGGISDIVKGGHHFAWVEYKDAVADDKPATQPKRVHIERMYEAADFASIFGWS